MKFPCRVELFHSNVCYGVERNWPRRLFGRLKFQDLWPHQKDILIRKMLKDGVKLYNRYVDEGRLRRRQRRQRNLALAEYYEERLLRYRYIRIKALGDDDWSDTDSESDCTTLTVIDRTSSCREKEDSSSATNTATDLNVGDLGSQQGFNVVEEIVITEGSGDYSDNRGTLADDSPSSDEAACIYSPPQFNSNEFVRIESRDVRFVHGSFNDSVELFLSQTNSKTG